MTNKKKVFISYEIDNDKRYKDNLLTWDEHKLYDFTIHDHSVDVLVNSTNGNVIKSVLSRFINQSPYFLVIVGENTHKSAWVQWEVEKAIELNKKIVAVKTDRAHTSPEALMGIGATWAMSFSYEAIIKAIDKA